MADGIPIREATEDDIPRLVQFLLQLDAHVAGVDAEVLALTEAGEQQLVERLRDFIDNPWKLVLVAEDADTGEVVAMGDIALWHYADIWHNPERKGLSSGVIDDVWVEPDYRQSGVGKAMLERLVAFAAANGIHDLMVEYSLSNDEARAAWERLGFRPTGVRAAATVGEVRRRLGDTGRKRRTNTDEETQT